MKISEFSSLRFLLALMIFLHHTGLYSGGGTMAVTVFFVLSGFCSALGYKDKVTLPDFSYKQYFIGKVIKFYPLHLITFLVALCWWYYKSYKMGNVEGGINYCYTSLNLFLLQSWIPERSCYFSLNALAWYLSDTIFFVAILPFFLRLFITNKRNVYVTFLVLLVVYAMLWVFLPAGYTHAIFYINPAVRFMDFALGVVLGLGFFNLQKNEIVMRLVKNNSVLIHAVSVVSLSGLVIISLVLPDVIQLHSVVYWPLVALLLITIALNSGTSRFLNLKVFQKCGNASFAFYMCHLLCIWIGYHLLLHFGISRNYIRIPFVFVVTLIFALTYTQFIDNRISKWLKKITGRLFTTAR